MVFQPKLKLLIFYIIYWSDDRLRLYILEMNFLALAKRNNHFGV